MNRSLFKARGHGNLDIQSKFSTLSRVGLINLSGNDPHPSNASINRPFSRIQVRENIRFTYIIGILPRIIIIFDKALHYNLIIFTPSFTLTNFKH